MNYCEKCKSLTDDETCPRCGNEILRKPSCEDYCFLTQADDMSANMITELLAQNEITCSLIPFRPVVGSSYSMRAGNYMIFLPYKDYDNAANIVNECFFSKKEDDIKNHLDKLNFNPRYLKKWKKRLRLTEREDFLEFCKKEILNTQKILNGGSIALCAKGGDYLFIYCDKAMITVNSATYEILSVKPVRK